MKKKIKCLVKIFIHLLLKYIISGLENHFSVSLSDGKCIYEGESETKFKKKPLFFTLKNSDTGCKHFSTGDFLRTSGPQELPSKDVGSTVARTSGESSIESQRGT